MEKKGLVELEKISFRLRISCINGDKLARNCGLINVFLRNLNIKLYFWLHLRFT